MITIQRLKFLDLFSGIGGFRLGMEQANNKCVGWCDIDKFARKSYKNMYDTRGEWIGKDIKAVTNSEWQKINQKYGKINVICGGFPCQSFSIAGKRKGFLDKTRGTLFFQIARAAKEIKPQYLFLENVKGLLNHRHGKTFKTILSTLDEIGYDVEWRVFNSKNFGVPQNRERTYIIGHRRGSNTTKIFSKSSTRAISNEQIKYYHKCSEQLYRVLRKDGIFHTLTASGFGGLMIYDHHKIRNLTPKECWRLQGYPDKLFNRAKNVVSDAQLYKQAGNSVSVPVIKYIAKRMKVY